MPWWRQIHRCLKLVPACLTRPEIPHNTIAHMLDALWSQKLSAALRTRVCPIKLCLHGAARQFSVESHCDPPPWFDNEWSAKLPRASLRRSFAFLLLSTDVCSDSYISAHRS